MRLEIGEDFHPNLELNLGLEWVARSFRSTRAFLRFSIRPHLQSEGKGPFRKSAEGVADQREVALTETLKTYNGNLGH